MEACAGERRREHGARGFSAPSGGHGSARPARPAAGCAAENRPAAAAGGGSVRGSLSARGSLLPLPAARRGCRAAASPGAGGSLTSARERKEAIFSAVARV